MISTNASGIFCANQTRRSSIAGKAPDSSRMIPAPKTRTEKIRGIMASNHRLAFKVTLRICPLALSSSNRPSQTTAMTRGSK